MAKTPSSEPAKTAEAQRLDEAREQGVPWRQWGPYLSERQWGTVREDYSADGIRCWRKPAWHGTVSGST